MPQTIVIREAEQVELRPDGTVYIEGVEWSYWKGKWTGEEDVEADTETDL